MDSAPQAQAPDDNGGNSEGGRRFAVFNPLGRASDELPVIYGFNNGGSPGWMHAMLLAEDGTYLGGHVCSSEGFMRWDLGILEGSRPDRHETFRQHYPDGYRMTFVSGADVPTHPGLNVAYQRYKAKAEGAPTRDASVPPSGAGDATETGA